MDVKQDKRIQRWFGMRNFAEGTEVTYLQYMQRFCDCIEKSPSELVDEAIAEIRQGVWVSDRKTVDYIIKFKKLLKDRELSPKAQAVAIACVKSFYKAFDIQLSASIGEIKKPLVRRENQTFITKDDIIKLITNAKSLRDKAIIITMATSGMARKEIINLRINDITFEKTGDNSEMGIVSVRRQKSQTDYITFISPEGVIALKNYFDERNRNKILKIKGNNDFVFVTHDNGSKIEDITFTFIFRQLAHQLV